jgi:hypothetical protein
MYGFKELYGFTIPQLTPLFTEFCFLTLRALRMPAEAATDAHHMSIYLPACTKSQPKCRVRSWVYE